MWIKKKGCRSVNTDHVQNIQKYSNGGTYILTFCQIKTDVQFRFDSLKELELYHENLMTKLEAWEISNTKSLTLT